MESRAQPLTLTLPDTIAPGVNESIITDGGAMMLIVWVAAPESGTPSESVAMTVRTAGRVKDWTY